MFHRHNHDRHHGQDHEHRHGERFARRDRGQDDLRHDQEWYRAARGHGGGHGGGYGGGYGGGRGGRGGLGRFFAHGDLRLVILNLIAEKPRHGYEIIKAIEERVGGAYSPSPGVIYPTLTLLEELGYVTTETESAKKLHTITDQGRAFLDANRAVLDTLLARMAEASKAQPGEPAPQLLRAMENLKFALRLRLSRGPLSQDQADAVAAALDTAANTVEKI
ncbi:MAG TPA: PadR family transcriptional regulator [Rhodopila sp.]|uniref:PadR family transcriptional regulator n=1 Tax=Rhodopila sp. TaxID=2480087 RepID=UPI002BD2A890|nr:PadR family transcriptional regulator [Rhodopila sp.]HVY16386.1 PadR family transcriptional regulator [Rhodopila sp.]